MFDFSNLILILIIYISCSSSYLLYINFTHLFICSFSMHSFFVFIIIAFIIFAMYIFIIQLYICQCNHHLYLILSSSSVILHSIFVIVTYEIFCYICMMSTV